MCSVLGIIAIIAGTVVVTIVATAIACLIIFGPVAPIRQNRMTTESGTYNRIMPWLGDYGCPVRIENAIASGLPDITFTAIGVNIWIELKVIKSEKIQLRPFQYAYASRTFEHIKPEYFWFLGNDGNQLRMYMFKTIKPFCRPIPGEKRIEVNLEGVRPDHILVNKSSIATWLNWIAKYRA